MCFKIFTNTTETTSKAYRSSEKTSRLHLIFHSSFGVNRILSNNTKALPDIKYLGREILIFLNCLDIHHNKAKSVIINDTYLVYFMFHPLFFNLP